MISFDEWLQEHEESIDKDHRYFTYRHVGYRLNERFGVDFRRWTLAQWRNYSYDCAIRHNVEVTRRRDRAIYCKGVFEGHRVMWLYCRDRKCITTVLPVEDTDFRFKYIEMQKKHK